ncbi:hypothetical protein D3C76_1830770 [compost metagenome]
MAFASVISAEAFRKASRFGSVFVKRNILPPLTKLIPASSPPIAIPAGRVVVVPFKARATSKVLPAVVVASTQ